MIDPSILLSDLINKPESHSSYCPLERFPSKVAPSQDGTLPTISWLRFHQPSPVADRSPPPPTPPAQDPSSLPLMRISPSHISIIYLCSGEKVMDGME